MELLSVEPVSDDYRCRLRDDIASAQVCRFAVAFVSNVGLQALRRSELVRVFSDERSFGVSSISCACRYEPLVSLNEPLPVHDQSRLKYFMDPAAPVSGEPGEHGLLHSKVVFLVHQNGERAAIYIGSHNWTGRALGTTRIRNAEVSVRIEVPFVESELNGNIGSIAGQTNAHLLNCLNLPLCVNASRGNVPRFEEWIQNVCIHDRMKPLETSTLVLAVQKTTHEDESVSSGDWINFAGKSIYLQIFDEQDGTDFPGMGERVLVLTWDSDDALSRGQQPVILICRVSTGNAGKDSEIRGSNVADNLVEGFEIVLWDDKQLSSVVSGSAGERRPIVSLPSGRTVSVFDLALLSAARDSQSIDRGSRPMYQFHLEIDEVVPPPDKARGLSTDAVWQPESFAVSDKSRVRRHRSPGFLVPASDERAMVNCLREIFGIPLEKAKALPYSEWSEPRVGRRVSKHGLHEAYLGTAKVEGAAKFYERSLPGWLVPEIDAQPTELHHLSNIERVLRVYTMPLATLRARWHEIASSPP